MAMIDRYIENIARAQHGAFNIHQAQAVGFTKSMVRTRIADGTWRRELRGVYTLTVFTRTWEQRLMCAALSKRDAVIAGRAACAYQQLDGFSRCRPELAVPPGTNSESKVAKIHRFRSIESEVLDGIPVTTIRQSIIDVAGTVPYQRVRDAAELACIGGRLTIEELGQRFLEIEPLQLAGVGDVRKVLDELGDVGYVPPQSLLERDLYAILRELRIPFVAQADVGWRAPQPMRLDALVPAWRLITEADGRRWHTRVVDRERDIDRDNVAAAHGFHVMRFSYRMITCDRRRVCQLLDDYRTNVVAA